MLSVKRRDVTKEMLMLFSICYEYQISFKSLVKLYNISSKLFWIFLETINPMLKMGIRKASNLKKSVDKMYECLYDLSKSYDILTLREEKILNTFKLFIEDSFSDGEGCLHISQFENMPNAVGYLSNGLRAASNYKELVKRIDDVAYVSLGDINFYKTSKIMFYLEKYSGDLSEKEVVRLTVKELLDLISDGVEKEHEKETEDARASF